MEDNDEIESDKKDPNCLKITLIGDSGVGKTCIINRYAQNEFTENTDSTLGVGYKKKAFEFNGKTYQLDLWDTAGQEQYRSVAKSFYINAAIGIMVYDIRRKSSFESIKEYWYEQMKESGEENMILGIAGNKCDLFTEEEVTEKEVKKFAESIGAVFKLTSCKENVGINELFLECGKKFLEVNNLLKNDDKGKKDNENLKIDGKNDKNNGNKGIRKCC